MIWPPSLLRVRVHGRSQRFSLWLPLFIVWLPTLALAAVISPLMMVLAALLWPLGWGRPFLFAGPLLFRLFCSLRGLEIAVENSSQRVLISFR